MTTNYRALCVDLLWALENAISIIYRENGTKHISTVEPIVANARAVLAEPEPPDEGEVAELVAWLRDHADSEQAAGWLTDAARFHRAAGLLERHP